MQLRVGITPASAKLAGACHRIVQESITNALKHAPGFPIDVMLRAAPTTGVRIVVQNPIPGGDAERVEGRTGSGLVGMSERAAAFGGTFTARADGGWFVVAAHIPWFPGPGNTL